jgi:hypothetical protein
MAAALVSMEQAKDHLRITSDDMNADIQLKIELASAIILDYLKGRANVTATITSASVASPSVLTTSAAHTFVNGQTVVITGDVDAVPTINGSWVISNVLGSSFTIPLAVTVASTGATATVVWDETTAPGPVQAAALLMLTHLYEHRGDDQKADTDLWFAVERLLMRSRDPAFA